MTSASVPYPAAKQVLDKCVAVTLVLVLSPLFAIVAGAIGIDALVSRRDRGPLLYRERRISLYDLARTRH